MTHITVTYDCGCTERRKISAGEATYMSENPTAARALLREHGTCDQCKAKQAQSAGLPKLTGSDKQVIWAAEIRAKFIRGIERIEADAKSQCLSLGTAPAGEVVRRLITEQENTLKKCAAIRSMQDAGWWIKHRLLPTKELLTRVN